MTPSLSEEIGMQPLPSQMNSFQSPMEKFQGAIIMLTNSDSILYKLELVYRCAAVDENGDLKPVGKSLMNDLGINNLIGMLASIGNSNTFFSNLENANEVFILIDFLADTLAKDLMINRTRYGIEDFGTRDKIYYITLNYAYLALKRAYKQGERIFWGKSLHENYNIITSDKKKGGSINPFGQKT